MRATSATVSPRSDIISVAVRGPNPDDAAALADLVVKAYRDFNDELKQSSASEVMKQLEKKKSENDAALDAELRRRLRFQQENAGLSFNREVRNPVLERVNLLSAALTQAELEMMTTQSEYETIKAMLDSPEKIRQLLSNPQYRTETYALRRELREMQNSLELMSATYLAGSPQMLARQQRMQRTREEIEAEEKAAAEAILASIEQRFRAAQLKAEQCRKFLNEQQAQVLHVNSKQ
ncbi:MAG: hypothetical protein NZ561_00830, partial [Phycisphaerae bacterium]|nr:hypothetical protein [Phycisphaerae bacterium]